MTTRPRRRSGPLALAALAIVGVAAMAAFVLHTTAPDHVAVTPTPTQRPETALDDADATAALVRPPDGSPRVVGPTGATRWTVAGTRAGAACLTCPDGLITTRPYRRVRPDGSVVPAADLADAQLVPGGIWLHRTAAGFEVWKPTPTGHLVLGTVPAQSLDAADYSVAPRYEASPDGRRATAIIGLPDRREVGRARVVHLAVGSPPVRRTIPLPHDGRILAPCQPPTAGTDRWGWLTSKLDGDLVHGTTHLAIATGPGRTRTIDLPWPAESCVLLEHGIVLVHQASDPTGNRVAAAWLDDTGRTSRRVAARTSDPRDAVSVAPATGAVLLPSGRGYDLVAADGARRHLAVESARLAPTGELWTVRDGRVRREAR